MTDDRADDIDFGYEGERREAPRREEIPRREDRRRDDRDDRREDGKWDKFIRWAKYSGIGLGMLILGNYMGSCASVPTKITVVDADQDGTKDIMVTDRGYLGLSKSRYTLVQRDGQFERVSRSELEESIEENASR